MTDGNGQLDLDFHAPVGKGYEAWQWDREQAVKKIAELWMLPLNQRVRIKLVNIDSEFEGELTLAEMPVRLDGRGPLLLRLTPLCFSISEIERCTRLE
jgi:hypothetical protein